MDVPSIPSTFRFTTRTGELRTIGEIADEDLPRYRSLGSGVGGSFILAFSPGTRHCPDFEDRVAGFRIEKGELAATLERETGRSYLSVRFYEFGDPHHAGRSARHEGWGSLSGSGWPSAIPTGYQAIVPTPGSDRAPEDAERPPA